MRKEDARGRAAEVLITGAGPVGMIAALLLAQQGLRSVIVERRAQRLTAPKAHALNPRSLEICESLGIPRDELARHAAPAGESADVRFLTRLNGIEIGKLPYERQDPGTLEFTPTPLLNIAQPKLENLLLARCHDNPLIEVRLGHRWIEATQDADTVVSTIRTDEDEYEIAARYMIGADGAGSAVRQFLSIGMDGPKNLEHRMMIHFRADLRPLLAARPAILYWTLDPAAQGTFIAYDLSSTFVFMHRVDGPPQQELSRERCEELVYAAIGETKIPIDIQHALPWTMNAQIADAYRCSRIFLAGDAAHRFPPSGGLGLNTGIQDAHNLAWKLALVLRGEAHESLLESYERERRPVALQNSNQSRHNAEKMGRIFREARTRDQHGDDLRTRLQSPSVRENFAGLIEQQREHFDSFRLQLGYVYGRDDDGSPIDRFVPVACPGARMPHGWITVANARRSSLSLLSPTGFTLICGPRGSGWIGTDWSMSGMKVVKQDRDFADNNGQWSRLMQFGQRGAVLIRPDGHILAMAADDGETSRRLMYETMKESLSPALATEPAAE